MGVFGPAVRRVVDFGIANCGIGPLLQQPVDHFTSILERGVVKRRPGIVETGWDGINLRATSQ